MNYLDFLVAAHHFGEPRGLISVCSAHPLVIEAALRSGLTQDKPVLIEATCNQVNQFGGYTGLTPAGFAHYVGEIADRVGFPRQQLILGGDHLGPLVWADEPAQAAMDKAKTLVRDYVQAGFTKIHLDCSMPLGGESQPPVEVIAQRAAELAQVAESATHELPITNHDLRYVIGSDVPPAGGEKGQQGGPPPVTSPQAAAETLQTAQQAFSRRNMQHAWERVVALVVQPGVDFGDEVIYEYEPTRAAGLKTFIESVPGLVYEAHSTDFQTPAALRAMVEDHFAILKVGPALTFALREALFALAEMEQLLCENPSRLKETLEAEMLAQPRHWEKYYPGDARWQRIARGYSWSDRIRYYWNSAAVQEAVAQLFRNLGDTPLPLSLLSQHLPREYEKVRLRALRNHPRELVVAHIHQILESYPTL